MAASRPWDEDTDDDGNEDDPDMPDAGLSDDDADLTPKDAAQRLFEYLEDSFLWGDSSAKTVAIVAYYAVKAGVVG